VKYLKDLAVRVLVTNHRIFGAQRIQLVDDAVKKRGNYGQRQKVTVLFRMSKRVFVLTSRQNIFLTRIFEPNENTLYQFSQKF